MSNSDTAIWPPDIDFSAEEFQDVDGRRDEAEKWFMDNGFDNREFVTRVMHISQKTIAFRSVSKTTADLIRNSPPGRKAA